MPLGPRHTTPGSRGTYLPPAHVRGDAPTTPHASSKSAATGSPGNVKNGFDVAMLERKIRCALLLLFLYFFLMQFQTCCQRPRSPCFQNLNI